MSAADDGTFYFFSPELLDSAAQTEGEADQPNLYVVQPGADPEFVATVDTSATKPGPKPKGFVTRDTFLSGLEGPEAIAVDQSNGDVYVAQRETQSVARFTSQRSRRRTSPKARARAATKSRGSRSASAAKASSRSTTRPAPAS